MWLDRWWEMPKPRLTTRFARPTTFPKASAAAVAEPLPEMPSDEPDDRPFTEDAPVEPTRRPLSALLDAPPTPSHISIVAVSIEDIDTLWDWVRADPSGTKEFMDGVLPANSPMLHNWARDLALRQRANEALALSILSAKKLIGLLTVDPIIRAAGHPPAGVLHLYIEPSSRESTRDLLPLLCGEVDRLAPGMSLMVNTPRAAWADLFQSFGFERTFVLTRRASVGDGSTDA